MVKMPRLPPTLEWHSGAVRAIDQTLLPHRVKILTIRTPKAMWQVIRRLAIRGAPALGCAAAYGVLLGIWRLSSRSTSTLLQRLLQTADYLATSRPTAVNLFWALERMKMIAHAYAHLPPDAFKKRLLAEAHTILEEDKAMARAIGKQGLMLLPRNKSPLGILTHCNAGRLATASYGTALAVLYAAQEAGRKLHVYADETRPLLQGARLTCWELMQAGIEVTLLCDNMAAEVMKEGKIDLVIVGADRIAANGDTANKIGTYGLAVLAKYHRIPFYVAAPSSTFDLSIPDGSKIPIEERNPDEVRSVLGRWIAPRQVPVYNPAFDVTPHELITAFITEHGVIPHPSLRSIRHHISNLVSKSLSS